MKRSGYLFLLFAGLLAFVMPSGVAEAGDGATLEISDDVSVTFSGSVRSRYEWSENYDFDDDFDDDGGFVDNRYRLGMSFHLPADVTANFGLQSLTTNGDASSAFSGRMPAGFPATSGVVGLGSSATLSDGDFDLYIGNIKIGDIGGTNFSLTLGRQELAFGSEFLLGDNDFYGGLSHDGIRGDWAFSNDANLSVFWMKLDERTSEGGGDFSDEDAELYGAWFNVDEIGAGGLFGIDAYIIGARSGMDSSPGGGDTTLNMWTVGGRVWRSPEYGFHFNAEIALQSGDFTPVGGTELDVGAWGFEGSAGWAFDVGGNPDIHVGYTVGSGDSDGAADGDWDAFNPLFQDPHPRSGLADFFGTSNIEIIQLGYAGSFENHAWGLDLYDVSFDEVASGDDSLGQEFDLYYTYQYSDNLAVNFVYSFLTPDDVIEATMGEDDITRLYANVRVSF
jgi:hypothetical protein